MKKSFIHSMENKASCRVFNNKVKIPFPFFFSSPKFPQISIRILSLWSHVSRMTSSQIFFYRSFCASHFLSERVLLSVHFILLFQGQKKKKIKQENVLKGPTSKSQRQDGSLSYLCGRRFPFIKKGDFLFFSHK